jgi:tRNA nucleotidyltransferase/poly(A) polymerase
MKPSLPNHIFESLPQAYLVGGSIRDLILGLKPLDYDLAVPSSPEKFAELMANRLNGKVIILGKDRFNVYRVVSETLSMDITALKHNDIDTDLKARDFTINALAYDLRKKEIIDRVGGLKDLQHRRITMASREAFQEDPLRLIRAFRMAVVMGFEIAPPTFQAIAREAAAIRNCANERIWTELQLIMACPDSYSAMSDMARTKLLFFVIPELMDLRHCDQNRFHMNDVFTHTLDAYGAMESHLRDPDKTYPPSAVQFIQNLSPKKQALMKMAILLHDIGKPASRQIDAQGKIHFYGHAGKSAYTTRKICKRMRMSKRQQDWVEMIVRYHQRPLALFLSRQGRQSLRPKTIGRFFRQCDRHTPYLLIHAVADNMGKGTSPNRRNDPMVRFFKELLATYINTIASSPTTPLINGNDLIRHFKLQPSPLVGRLLRNVKELQMAGKLKTHEQALGWVTDHLKHPK